LKASEGKKKEGQIQLHGRKGGKKGSSWKDSGSCAPVLMEEEGKGMTKIINRKGGCDSTLPSRIMKEKRQRTHRAEKGKKKRKAVLHVLVEIPHAARQKRKT